MLRSVVTAIALAVAACSPQYAVEGRAYELKVPSGFDGVTPLPLVIMVHGYGATGELQDQFFPVSGQVDSKRFLYALPNGTPDANGKRFWNATEACCDNGRIGVDDVGFFRALVADVAGRFPLQEGRVFLVGHSNGAFMSLRLACEASDLFAGVVAVAGSTFLESTRCQPGRAVPVLLAHGDRDASVPIEGRPGRFPGARETGSRYGRRNGCSGGWVDGERLDLLGGPDAESQVSRIEGCPREGSIELWTHEAVGHLPLYDGRWTSRIIDWLWEHAR